MNNEPNTQPNLKKCTSCGIDIPATANICHNCKSHQSIFKNNLLFFSSVAGLISIFATGAAVTSSYIYSFVQDIFHGEYLSIYDFSYDNGYVRADMLNMGSRPIFIRGIKITYNDTDFYYTVSVLISPNSTQHWERYTEPKDDNKNIFASHSTKDDEIRSIAWKYALEDFEKAPSDRPSRCVRPIFSTSGDPSNAMVESHYKLNPSPLIVDHGVATIHYYSLDSTDIKYFRFNIDITYTINRSDRNCEYLIGR